MTSRWTEQDGPQKITWKFRVRWSLLRFRRSAGSGHDTPTISTTFELQPMGSAQR